MITGDMMHHPVQCAEPEWTSHFDFSQAAARATRRAFLERYGDNSFGWSLLMARRLVEAGVTPVEIPSIEIEGIPDAVGILGGG